MERIKKNKTLTVLAILIALLTVLFLGKVTYSFLGPTIDDIMHSRGGITSQSGYSLTFSKGNDLDINASIDNFGTGDGNLQVSTNPTATLTNGTGSSVTATYVAGIIIAQNTFQYSTAGNTPELILTVLDENGNAVTTSSDSLTYVTSGGVSGFDVTNKKGAFNIVINHSITTSSTTTHTWTFRLTFVNLGTDQGVNEAAKFSADVILKATNLTTATFDTGETVNTKLKTLANGGTVVSNVGTTNNNVGAIVKAESLPSGFTATTANTVSSSSSASPIYAWYTSSDVMQVLVGDINGDGEVARADATILSRFLTNQNSLTQAQLLVADVDLNGTVDEYDEELLSHYVGRWNSVPDYMGTATINIPLSMDGADSYANNYSATLGTIYYYSEADMVYLNSNSSKFLRAFLTLGNISGLQYVNADNTSNISQFFFDTGILHCNDLKKWDVSSVTDITYLFGWNDANRDYSNLINVYGLSDWDITSASSFLGVFRNNKKLINIDGIANWEVSSIQSLEQFMVNCTLVTDIDALKYWNVSNVTNMTYTFGNTGIVDLSALTLWDTSKVTNVTGMFKNCSSLTSVDLSNFDMHLVTTTTEMLNNVNAIQTLKTPKVYPTNSSITITLPATMRDSSGNTYSTLNNSSPTQILLTKSS